MNDRKLVRIKAGTPAMQGDAIPGKVRPFQKSLGRKWVGVVGVESSDCTSLYCPESPESPESLSYRDTCSTEYLEPWVEGETWNGSAWVPVAATPSPSVAITAEDLDIDPKSAASYYRPPVAQDVTLRDWFAMAALTGGMPFDRVHDDYADAAKEAYAMADAMIAARDARRG